MHASSLAHLRRRSSTLERECKELKEAFDQTLLELMEYRPRGGGFDIHDLESVEHIELAPYGGSEGQALAVVCEHVTRIRQALDDLREQTEAAADVVQALDLSEDDSRTQALDLLRSLARSAREFRRVLAYCKRYVSADLAADMGTELVDALRALSDDSLQEAASGLETLVARLAEVLPTGGRALQPFPASVRLIERGWRSTSEGCHALTLELAGLPDGTRRIEAFALDAFGRVIERVEVVHTSPFQAGQWVECTFEEATDPAAFRVQVH